MAKLTLDRSRKDARGGRVRPLQRVRVVLPSTDDLFPEPTVVRLTLRSDGAVLRAVKLSNRWSSPAVMGKLKGGQDPFEADLAKIAERLYPRASGISYEWDACRVCGWQDGEHASEAHAAEGVW